MDALLGTLWPGFVYARPDELLSSWLVRLAHAHLLKVHTFCAVTWPGLSIWNRDIDKSAPAALLATLARRTPATPARIWETTLASYEGRLYQHHNAKGNTDWILPLGIYHRTRRRYGLLFCPSCLRLDGHVPYFRKAWRLAFSFACTTCGVELHEKCPSCSMPVMFFRQELGQKSAMPRTLLSTCFHCGFDLAQAAGVPAPAALLRAQAEWQRVLTEGWQATVFYPHQYFAVLRQVAKVLNQPQLAGSDLHQTLSAQTGIASLGAGSFVHGPLEQWPLVLRRTRLVQAQWLLTDWPGRFIGVMKQHRITSTPLLREFAHAPFWYASVVLEHLYVNNVNRRFAAFWT